MYKELEEPIEVSKISVSIQASRTHYCIPRDDIGPYTHKEIAIMSETKWLDTRSPELAKYPKLRELNKVYEQSQHTNVGYYVPVDLIKHLVRWLKAVSIHHKRRRYKNR